MIGQDHLVPGLEREATHRDRIRLAAVADERDFLRTDVHPLAEARAQGVGGYRIFGAILRRGIGLERLRLALMRGDRAAEGRTDIGSVEIMDVGRQQQLVAHRIARCRRARRQRQCRPHNGCCLQQAPARNVLAPVGHAMPPALFTRWTNERARIP